MGPGLEAAVEVVDIAEADGFEGEGAEGAAGAGAAIDDEEAFGVAGVFLDDKFEFPAGDPDGALDMSGQEFLLGAHIDEEEVRVFFLQGEEGVGGEVIDLAFGLGGDLLGFLDLGGAEEGQEEEEKRADTSKNAHGLFIPRDG